MAIPPELEVHIREINKSRCTIPIAWCDVPHLTEDAKDAMRRSTPEHMASAREFGIPAIGSGRIFPVNVKDIREKPFVIPPFWPRCFALDVGIRLTACLWLAWDQESDVLHLFSEHYKGGVVPSVHAKAILMRGAWIPGVIDPSARNRSPTDGQRLFQMYSDEGLNLTPAKNAVDSGIYRVNELFAQDRIRVFANLEHFFDEIRWYRRDENGKIVKKNDHLMDSLRYLIAGYEQHAIVKPFMQETRTHYRPGSRSVGY